MFYFKLTPELQPIFSSFLGGKGTEPNDLWRTSYISVRRNGEFALCSTVVDDFPVIVNARQPVHGGGYMDAFVALFDSGGTPVWSTFHGGSKNDEGYSVTFDGEGNVLVAGETWSDDFPVSRSFQSMYGGNSDAFIAKYSRGGELVWSTYCGGSESDITGGITCDSSDNVYATGSTVSPDFPVYRSLQPFNSTKERDAFVVKLDSGGARIWSTYLGGMWLESGSTAACDGRDYLYVGGVTESPDFPTYNAIQDSIRGRPSPRPPLTAYITRFDPDGTIPVVLSRLSAARVTGGVELRWSSESEVNAHGYAVERSDARTDDWADVGFVPARGGADARSYTWLDDEPGRESRTSRYRLRMIDSDGSHEHSPVVEVGPARAVPAVGFEAVYPAPAHDRVTVCFALPRDLPVTLTVHDLAGREVARPHDGEMLPAGRYTVMLPVSAWRSGVYVYTLRAGEATRTRRGLVLR